MTDTPNRPPLWKVLHQAHLEEAGMVRYITGSEPVLGEPDRFTRAAEIRALRGWLVPEEIEPTGMRPCGDTYSAQSIKRGERQRLRALLTAEADRAEQGEVE